MSRSNPQHAMGNGQSKQLKDSLLNMLGSLTPSDNLDWKSHILNLTHAYNCTRYGSTGYSPSFLLLGRQPRLPTDLVWGIENLQTHRKAVSNYVEGLRTSIKAAYSIVAKHSDLSQVRQKKTYDHKVWGVSGASFSKKIYNTSPLGIFGMKKIMATKVISELKSLSKLFPKTGRSTGELIWVQNVTLIGPHKLARH